MPLISSETQIYYHLLDLDDSQKQQYLDELQQSQPELYLQVAPLLASESEEEQLTQLLGFGASLATTKEVDLTGEVISKYRLTHELGRGGMGVVYAAEQEALNREVAIKLILAEHIHNAEVAARFQREARVIAKLNHPQIVTIHDFG